MIRRIQVVVSTIAVILTSLTGCADHKELEQLAHVVVLGLDKSGEEFLRVTFQIANPQVGSTDIGQAEKEPASDIITITATDLLTARELANTIIPRKMNFTHLQTMVISEKLARSPKFHNIIASQIRQPEIRREMNLIICKETASEFIKKNNPRLETRPHKYYEFMMEQWRESGIVPISTLNRYLQRLSGEIFLAVYATTDRVESPKEKKEADYEAGEVPSEAADPVQMIGSAVIKDGRMIDTITGDETRMALMLRRAEKTHTYIDSFQDPLDNTQRVTVRLLREQPTRIQIDVSQETPKIQATVPLGVQVLSIQSLENYVTDQRKQRMLEEEIKRSLETEASEFIKKTQEKFRSDPFQWHLEVRKKFWTWEEYLNYDWLSKYPRADVNVEFDIQIESFGKQFEPAKIIDSEGEHS